MSREHMCGRKLKSTLGWLSAVGMLRSLQPKASELQRPPSALPQSIRPRDRKRLSAQDDAAVNIAVILLLVLIRTMHKASFVRSVSNEGGEIRFQQHVSVNNGTSRERVLAR